MTNISKSALSVAFGGWLIGAAVSLLLNISFGYSTGLQIFGDSPDMAWFVYGMAGVLGCLDLFKNKLGTLFSRLLAVKRRWKASGMLVLGAIVYVAFIGLSASSTNTFFSDKAKQQQTNSPTHIAKMQEIAGLEKTYKANERTYDNVVLRNDERRKLGKAPLEKEEVQKKDAMDESRAKLKTAKDEYNALPKGSQSWFARNGEKFGLIFTGVLEVFIFFCSFCIAVIKEDDAASHVVTGVTIEQNNAVTSNVTDVTQSVTAPLLTGFIEDASVIKAVTKDNIYSNVLTDEEIAKIILKDDLNQSYKAIRLTFGVGTDRAKNIKEILQKQNNVHPVSLTLIK